MYILYIVVYHRVAPTSYPPPRQLYEQRARLVEEKTAAEESATRLRTELQRWRLLWTAPSALVDDARPRNSSPARKGRSSFVHIEEVEMISYITWCRVCIYIKNIYVE